MLTTLVTLAVLLAAVGTTTAQHNSCFQQINDAHVLCVEEDATFFYAGTKDQGLIRYEWLTLLSTVYDSSNSPLASNNIRAMTMLDGALVVCTDSSLFVLEADTLRLLNDSLSGELAVAHNGNLIVAADTMYYELRDNEIVYSKSLPDLVTFACDICEKTTDVVVTPNGDVWLSHYSFYEFDILQYDGNRWTLHDIGTTNGVLPIESWSPHNRLMWWSDALYASTGSPFEYKNGTWTNMYADGFRIVNDMGDTLNQAITDMETYFEGAYWVGTHHGFETQDSKSAAGSIAFYGGSKWFFTQLPLDSAASVVRLRVSAERNGTLFVGTTHGLLMADTKCLSFPTSVDEDDLTQRQSRPNLYPNPSTGLVRFTKPLTGILEVWNTSGQRVVSLAQGTWSSIDLSALPKGVYVLQIRGAGESHQYKVGLR